MIADIALMHNVIIPQPTLNKPRVVVSTYHMMIKKFIREMLELIASER